MAATMPEGINVPRWLKEAVIALLAVLAFGMLVGAKLQQLDRVDFRLCRIEKALQVDPDQSCYGYRGFAQPTSTSARILP